MESKKISIIFGTRPEAIKLAPLILALKNHPSFQVEVCVTAQHRHMLDQVLEIFEIVPDADLDLMKPNQTLASLTSDAIRALDTYLLQSKPDMVLVQGDTTTVFAAALASFYHRIPVGHVEAGLRTGNKYSPFPEEANRVITSRLAELHFAPTKLSQSNLLAEGIDGKNIHVTGNTVIDALFMVRDKFSNVVPEIPGLPEKILHGNGSEKIVLITGHRRENFGGGFLNICRGIARLADRFPEMSFVYPVHLNPNVQSPVYSILSGRENIHLIAPLSYVPFVALMHRATVILTDSGGVQEEAPSLGKPVLVMRENTERPEAVTAGTVRMVGTDEDLIVSATAELLEDQASYDRMAKAVNPYGDGKASDRIVQALSHYFFHEDPPALFVAER